MMEALYASDDSVRGVRGRAAVTAGAPEGSNWVTAGGLRFSIKRETRPIQRRVSSFLASFSDPWVDLMNGAGYLARRGAPTILRGTTGAMYDEIAELIHMTGRNAARSLVSIDCWRKD